MERVNSGVTRRKPFRILIDTRGVGDVEITPQTGAEKLAEHLHKGTGDDGREAEMLR